MASAGGGTINLAATGTANYALELPASSPDAHTAFRRTFSAALNSSSGMSSSIV